MDDLGPYRSKASTQPSIKSDDAWNTRENGEEWQGRRKARRQRGKHRHNQIRILTMNPGSGNTAIKLLPLVNPATDESRWLKLIVRLGATLAGDSSLTAVGRLAAQETR